MNIYIYRGRCSRMRCPKLQLAALRSSRALPSPWITQTTSSPRGWGLRPPCRRTQRRGCTHGCQLTQQGLTATWRRSRESWCCRCCLSSMAHHSGRMNRTWAQTQLTPKPCCKCCRGMSLVARSHCQMCISIQREISCRVACATFRTWQNMV